MCRFGSLININPSAQYHKRVHPSMRNIFHSAFCTFIHKGKRKKDGREIKLFQKKTRLESAQFKSQTYGSLMDPLGQSSISAESKHYFQLKIFLLFWTDMYGRMSGSLLAMIEGRSCGSIIKEMVKVAAPGLFLIFSVTYLTWFSYYLTFLY